MIFLQKFKKFLYRLHSRLATIQSFVLFYLRRMFIPLRPHPMHDEFWTRNEIIKALHRNGVLIEKAHRDGRSIHCGMEGRVISGVRMIAKEKGWSQEAINASEMDGERDQTLIFEPVKVVVKFAFYNSGEHYPLAEYHIIESNHPEFPVGGNVDAERLIRCEQKVPRTPSYEKWVRQGRPCFRGC